LSSHSAQNVITISKTAEKTYKLQWYLVIMCTILQSVIPILVKRKIGRIVASIAAMET